MSKRVFFSFHYQDVIDFRANVVRQHWVTKLSREDAGFFDASIWEEARKASSIALKRLINSGLDGTSVTCVLIGTETYKRPWVRYELMKSYLKGNKLLAIHINSISGRDRLTKPLGQNPLAYLGVAFSEDGNTGTLYESVDGAWQPYSEVDGSSQFSIKVGSEHRGKGFVFSEWYSTYDWVRNDGYNNFNGWIG